ncbi:MAG: DUF1565 domain-containing protein [bacterium]|nr:DUF1565 domain-containing protein [bacterium]
MKRILTIILSFGLLYSVAEGKEKTTSHFLQSKEASRIVYNLDMENVSGYEIHKHPAKTLKALPIGSYLDKQEGIFYWQPAPGFLGRYSFLFTSPTEKKLLTIHIVPAFGNGITRCEKNLEASADKPFGEFATPIDGSTVRSSVPITGWALDDVGVDSVKIYRESGGSLVYIGDAVFIEGARSDVEAAYPNHPSNSAAGWGYMMLTYFLPSGGNGIFTIHAVATDTDGNSVTLGTKTITCDNANAVKPFGALDAPAQGGTASGTAYACQGWVLTPMPNKVPENGSTINVYVDGVSVGQAEYNLYRPDIASLFPGYANSGGSQAYFELDTTTYANGVHTIAMIAVDNAGNTDGIGSRHFIISDGTTPLSATCTASPQSGAAPLTVSFNCTASGGSTNSYSYSWDLGDGSTGTTQAASHTYQSIGTYTATVTVTSGTDTATCSKTITVSQQETADYYVSVTGSDSNNGTGRDTAFRTISHAFDVVRPGEKILVLAGTYNESITLENKGNASGVITLKGESSLVILDGERTRTLGIWCESCTNIVLDTLVIRNYSDIGAGALQSSDIVFRNLTVHNNGFAVQLTGWELEGYGIDVDECSDILIEANDVYENGPNPQVANNLMGTGINTFTCIDCIIRNNLSYENIGGGYLIEDGVNVLFEGNDAYDNDCDASAEEWWDGGLWVDGGHDITVRNNTFTGNLGAGIEISDEDLQNPYGYILENNVITGNYYGVFLWNFGGTDWPAEDVVQRSGNIISGNTVQDVWIVDWILSDD